MNSEGEKCSILKVIRGSHNVGHMVLLCFCPHTTAAIKWYVLYQGKCLAFIMDFLTDSEQFGVSKDSNCHNQKKALARGVDLAWAYGEDPELTW